MKLSEVSMTVAVAAIICLGQTSVRADEFNLNGVGVKELNTFAAVSELGLPEAKASYDPDLAGTFYMYLTERGVNVLKDLRDAELYVSDSEFYLKQSGNLNPDQSRKSLAKAEAIYTTADLEIGQKMIPMLKTLIRDYSPSFAMTALLNTLPEALNTAIRASEETPATIAALRKTISSADSAQTKGMPVKVDNIESTNVRVAQKLAEVKLLMYRLAASPVPSK